MGRLGKIGIVCFRINSFVKSSRSDKNGNCSVLIESTIASACLISLDAGVCREASIATDGRPFKVWPLKFLAISVRLKYEEAIILLHLRKRLDGCVK